MNWVRRVIESIAWLFVKVGGRLLRAIGFREIAVQDFPKLNLMPASLWAVDVRAPDTKFVSYFKRNGTVTPCVIVDSALVLAISLGPTGDTVDIQAFVLHNGKYSYSWHVGRYVRAGSE